MAIRFIGGLLGAVVLACNVLGGPIAWFDGSDPSGTGSPPDAGTPISQWVDKSGTMPSLGAVNEPPIGVSLPTFNPAGLNGEGTIAFRGSQILESPFDIRSAFNEGVDYTTFTVFKTGVSSPLNVLWADRPSDGPAHTVSLIGNKVAVRAGAQDARSLDTVNNNRGHLVTYGVDAGAGFFDLNGRVQANAPGVSSTLVDPGTFVVGGGVYSDNSAGTFFNGEIGEIVMFDRALSTQERADVNAYLGDKWGIGVSGVGDEVVGENLVSGFRVERVDREPAEAIRAFPVDLPVATGNRPSIRQRRVCLHMTMRGNYSRYTTPTEMFLAT